MFIAWVSLTVLLRQWQGIFMGFQSLQLCFEVERQNKKFMSKKEKVTQQKHEVRKNEWSKLVTDLREEEKKNAHWRSSWFLKGILQLWWLLLVRKKEEWINKSVITLENGQESHEKLELKKTHINSNRITHIVKWWSNEIKSLKNL